MAEAKLHLEVVTTEKRILETDCDSVSIPASQGYVTILPEHTALISLLGTGTLTIVSGSKSETLVVGGGFFEVSDNGVRILAHLAQRPDQIDAAAARQEADEARAALGKTAGEEQAAARRRLQRAEARLAVAKS